MGRRHLLSLFVGLMAITCCNFAQPGGCVALYWYDDGIPPPEFPLADSCVAGTPLPDGTLIVVYWDADGNGPDETDPVAPLCSNPPECEDGPPGTFNLNSFALNGQATGDGAGYFEMDYMICYGWPMAFPRIYLRICLNGMRWESSVVDMSQPSPENPTWTCVHVQCANCPSPLPVSSFTASDSQCENVWLNWSYSDTITDVDLFKLFRNDSLIGVVSADSQHVFHDANAPAGQSIYGIQARRLCQQDSAYSSSTTDLGGVPPPPNASNVNATDGYVGGVEITWSYASNAGLESWIVRRNQDSVGVVEEHGAPPGVRSFVEHPPVNEVFSYDVVAVGTCALGNPSSSDSGWTAPTNGGPGFMALLFREGPTPLTDECANGTPLPDGTPIWIYWDADGDGPDLEDPLPTTDDSLPSPPNSVNFDEIAMNGEAQDLGAGYFVTETYFESLDGLSIPPRYYLRICLADRHWESPVFMLQSGAQEIDFASMFCTDIPCSTLSAMPHEPVVSDFRLDPVYPNPFNSLATIRFALPRDERVQIQVFDVTGKRTTTLLDEWSTSGEHRVTWDAAGIPSGLYFVSVTAGAVHQTQKLVLLK